MSHEIPAIGGVAPPDPVVATPAQQATAAAPPPPATAARAMPNPSLRLDPGLGMVVLEFHDAAGQVTSSIPSERVLKAYRSHTDPISGAQRTTCSFQGEGRPDTTPDRVA